MTSPLRSKLIRLAHAKPELRADLLPLLTKQARGKNANAPKDEVYTAMLGLMPYAERKWGKQYLMDILLAPPVPKGQGMSPIKQLQGVLVYALSDAAHGVKFEDESQYLRGRGGQLGAPMPKLTLPTALWFINRTDSVQYTLSRMVLKTYAKKLGIQLDESGLIS